MTYRQHDPGDECSCTQHQLALNIPELRVCSCGVSRKNLCPIDAALRWAAEAPVGRRPKTCLRRVDPSTAPFPPGY